MDLCVKIPDLVDLIRDYLPHGLDLLLPELFPRPRLFNIDHSTALIKEAIEYDLPCLLRSAINLEADVLEMRDEDEYIFHFHAAMMKPTSACFSVLWETVRHRAHAISSELVDECIASGREVQDVKNGENQPWFMKLYFDGKESRLDKVSDFCFDEILCFQPKLISILWRAVTVRNKLLFSSLKGGMTVGSVRSRPDLVRDIVEAGTDYVEIFLQNFSTRPASVFQKVSGFFLKEASRTRDRRAAREIIKLITGMGVELVLDVAGVVMAEDGEMLKEADGSLRIDDLATGLREMEEMLSRRDACSMMRRAIIQFIPNEEEKKELVIMTRGEASCLEVLLSYLEGERKICEEGAARQVKATDLEGWSGDLKLILSLLRASNESFILPLVSRLRKLV